MATSADLFPAGDSDVLAMEGGSVRVWRSIRLPRPPDELLERLIDEAPWREEGITLFGKHYLQPRLLSWHGDPGKSYRYSGVDHVPLPWTPLLREIQGAVEFASDHSFNSVLLNYYRDHRDSMGMHADDEPELGSQPVIASLSLGEERTFVFKHKRDKSLASVKVVLPSGSLLLMSGDTQRNWKHCIAKERRPCGPRVNLTFRTII